MKIELGVIALDQRVQTSEIQFSDVHKRIGARRHRA